MKYSVIFLILLMLFIIPHVYADDTNSQSLNFDVIKTKYMDVSVAIEIPIYLDKYNASSSFTLKTPVFIDTRTQIVDLKAYYYNGSEKIFASFEDDSLGNKFAVFDVNKVILPEYIFHIDARIISKNKIVFSEDKFSLDNLILDYPEFKVSTRYINSDRSEIISTSRFLKKTNYALGEITNVVDWTYNYVDYDLTYADKIVEAVKILKEKKGVCSEFSILAASILRERGFPTRYVTGYANSSVEWQPHAWLEVFIPSQGWVSVDPTFGEVGLVDASHLLISRIVDPSDIKDKITAYGDVVIRFGEKKADFKINDHKSFSDLGYSNSIFVDLVYPDKIKEKSSFFITAKITNTTSRPITTLFMLNLNADFDLIYPYKNRIIYLEPFKEEEITYYISSENTNIPANYFKDYSFSLISQVSDYKGKLSIYKDQGFFQEAFFITKPFFYLDVNNLNLNIDIINYTSLIKKINFNFNNNGILEDLNIEIEPQSIYNFIKSFNVVKNSKFVLDLTGDYTLSENYYIYNDVVRVDKNISDVNIVDNLIDNNADVNSSLKNDIWSEIKSDRKVSFVNDNKNSIIGIIIISLFIIIILIIFLSRNKDKHI